MKKERPTRASDFSAWYNYVVQAAGLAEHSSVRGCMVVKPNGYAIWEVMQQQIDRMLKDTGHRNAYFPLFIPKSHMNREASHVEGFATECAVVTHYRLRRQEGKLEVDPTAKLEEPLIVRPTSETVIWNTYKQWIQSYRDLPLLLNQWANVVRWEMRTRLFLRTSEFLWQEGHTAHSSRQEAEEEALRILDLYTKFVEEYMAVPVLRGRKSERERFAGAEETYCIEALMQDGRALQAGTSHFLGQNFAKAFDVQYATQSGALDYVWGTSWGVSMRLMGALIMVHADDVGLVLPPRLAPLQVIIVPIYRSEEERASVDVVARELLQKLRRGGLSAQYDSRDTHKPGWKFAEYEAQGVPLRLSVGPRDVAAGTVEVVRRDSGEKQQLPADEQLFEQLQSILSDIQAQLFTRAKLFLQAHTQSADTYADFREKIEAGGFVLAHWDGHPETEVRIQEETKATLRCIPLDRPKEQGSCILTGRPSAARVVFARAY